MCKKVLQGRKDQRADEMLGLKKEKSEGDAVLDIALVD